MRALFEKAQVVNSQLNWQKILSVGFFLLVAGLLVRGGYWVSDWLVENQDAQIKKIVVLGKPKYTTDKAVIAAIKQVDLSSYFQLNVKAVQRSVQGLPWVATVSVRKQWPDKLQVYIVEHKPVAIWNSDLLLNAKGQVFQADNEALQAYLPQLYGPEGSEIEAWQAFLQFKDMLAVNDFNLVSLALSERFAWQLWLEEGVRLNLGREEKARRVQRFIDVYPSMQIPEGGVLDTVDLRYDTGLAVSWKFPAQTEQQNKSEA